jgi:hypothetical protein
LYETAKLVVSFWPHTELILPRYIEPPAERMSSWSVFRSRELVNRLRSFW